MEALFSIGQKVVCVDSKDYMPHVPGVHAPLIEGKTYPVKSMKGCVCGNVLIDVGLPPNPPNYSVTCDCGYKHVNELRWLVEQTRFVPLDDDRAMDEQIRESLNQHLIER